jgi:hypothetical protein
MNMNLIFVLVVLVPLVSLVDAFIKFDTTVICSRIGPKKFEVCAIATYQTPQVGQLSPHVFGYEIVQGIPEGSDAYDLPQEALTVAQRSGISVEVTGLEKTCSVTVAVKGNRTQCRSCSYCNQDPTADKAVKEWFIADCTNIPNGRFTGCESAALDTFMFAGYAGADPVAAVEGAEVFFPLRRRALPAAPTPPTAPKRRPPTPTAPKRKAPAMTPSRHLLLQRPNLHQIRKPRQRPTLRQNQEPRHLLHQNRGP